MFFKGEVRAAHGSETTLFVIATILPITACVMTLIEAKDWELEDNVADNKKFQKILF